MRSQADRPVRSAALCSLGYLAAFNVFVAMFLIDFALLRVEGKVPLLLFARQILFPSWWALPGVLAVPLGLTLAIWLRAGQIRGLGPAA